jgi:hypothetical protein
LAVARRTIEQTLVPNAFGHSRTRHCRQLIGQHLRVGLLLAAHELELDELRGEHALHVGDGLLHVGHRERLQALALVPQLAALATCSIYDDSYSTGVRSRIPFGSCKSWPVALVCPLTVGWKEEGLPTGQADLNGILMVNRCQIATRSHRR